ARRRARALRDRLDHTLPLAAPNVSEAEPLLRATAVSVRYGARTAVTGVDLDVYGGRVLGIMGRNGSGKSSLLWAMQGSGRRDSGSVDIGALDPARLSAARARALVGLVPQTASDLLYLESVGAECAAADRESGAREGRCWALVCQLAPGIDAGQHPRDLSEGQKLALVLAVQLTTEPPVVLLDEPTRGHDYRAKERVGSAGAEVAARGVAVVIATHDVEFAAQVADRVIVVAQGELVSEGLARDVLAESPAFAAQ